MFGEVPACWLPTGDHAFHRMLAAIDAARTSVRLETYIFAVGDPGERFRVALARAAGRGVAVRVLVDAWGSRELPEDWWGALRAAGGEVREFNPLSLERLAIRDHRKLLVVDDSVAFVGGFNVAPEYLGDGVERGWFDLGVELCGAVVALLAESFERMWQLHEFRHPFAQRWRRRAEPAGAAAGSTAVLATGPGLGANAFRRRLLSDLRWARNVEIVAAYFVPGFRLRRALQRVVRRGGRVRLVLAGRTDVPMAQLAARSFYARLLRAGVEIAEYQPQVLHAKLALIDDAVYVGSSNLDARSFDINYEVMVRLHDPALAEAGRWILRQADPHCRRVERAEWSARRTWLDRLRGRWAAFLLTKFDPWIARRQLRRLV